MYKKYLELILFLIIVTGLTLLCIKFGPRNPDYKILQPVKDIRVDSMEIAKTTIVQGETLQIDATIYNASRDKQSTSTAVYMIAGDKIYDGSNADYISNKHITDIAPKTSEKIQWQIPLYFPAGEYRFMVGLHSFNNGVDKFAEDYWYKKSITINKPLNDLDTITGEDQNQNGITYITDSIFRPSQAGSTQDMFASFRVNNNGPAKNIVAGVYIIDKNKTYTSHNQDLSFAPQTKEILSGSNEIFEWSEAATLPPGEYRIMYWIHYLNESSQEIWIQDYWLPGYFYVENNE